MRKQRHRMSWTCWIMRNYRLSEGQTTSETSTFYPLRTGMFLFLFHKWYDSRCLSYFWGIFTNRHAHDWTRCKKMERKRKTLENDDLENKYESKYAKEMDQTKSVRVLLPIKTKRGLTMQTAHDEDLQFPKTTFENSATNCKLAKTNMKGEQVNADDESGKVISTAMLLARRKDKLNEYKMKIGILSASFLEDPENRVSASAKLTILRTFSNVRLILLNYN